MADQTVYVRPPIWALMAAVVIGGCFYISGKSIEADNDPADQGTISVSGEGRAFVSPDIGLLSLGVQTGRQPTAAAAMENLKKNMDAVIAAVKAEGVEDKDISTQSFYLSPVYDYTNGRQISRGFEASQSLSVKVRDLDKVSAVLGAGTAAGANQSGGVNFTVDDPEAKRAEARAEAIAAAKEKAKVLADQLNVDLGDIISFSEGYGGYVPPMYYSREAYGIGGGMDVANQEKAAVQLPAGEQEVNVTVTITYDID